jgi:dipeptidyl aminopeptidase/acylaminoacyl peptidase
MKSEWGRAMPRGWMAAAAFVLGVVSARAAEPVPVQTFFEMPAISEVDISPTGRHIALVAANKDGRNQVVVIDTATMKPFVAAASKERDIGRIRWVNDKRLVYSVSPIMREAVSYPRLGSLFAVDLDGQEHRPVISVSKSPSVEGAFMVGYVPHYYGRTWLADSDNVFVIYPQHDSHWEVAYTLLKKIDTRTGLTTQIEGPPGALSWYIGPGDGPRAVLTREGPDKYGIHIKNLATGKWELQRTFDTASSEAEFSVVGYASDDTLYVEHQPPGATNAGLYTYDIKTKTFSPEPIVNAKGFDLDGFMIRSRDKILGLRFDTDAETTVWFDADMKKVQAKVDALLPSTVNRISVPLRAETTIVLVTAYSDADPGTYYLYDTKAGKLTDLGRRRPRVDPARMAHRDFVRFKARDGLEIPAWVTVPKDGKKGPHPMVVLVHGGPWVRGGDWRWDADSQFLASRGYVVLEPEFRGSTGFGHQHFKAGWKQWGLAMQNDVADGTRWAIDKGLADPKRICIAGASYGGYATLMGLVNDPDLYRCGIEWVGVTDISLMYSISWSDTSESSKKYGMPLLVGDPEKDAAQLKATSPIAQASRIKQPLLLAYGGLDDRVPLKHGTEFRDAVTKTNPDVEWVVYPEGGHGWSLLKDNVDWWTRVEKFLARNIGEGSKQ